MEIRLLIADDHQCVRDGLRYAMSGTDIQIVGEADNGEAAVHLALQLDLDVALLDIRMPRTDGIEALSRIKAVKTNLPVLIYSAEDQCAHVQRCVDLGAAGYLSKTAAPQEVLGAIRRAAKGGSLWDRQQENPTPFTRQPL